MPVHPVARPAPAADSDSLAPTPEQMARGCVRASTQIADAEEGIGQPWIAWMPMLEVYQQRGWLKPHQREAGEAMLRLGLQAGRRDLVTHRTLDGLRRGRGDGPDRAARELRDVERAVGPRCLKAVDMVVFRNLRAAPSLVAEGLERAAQHLRLA